MGSACWQLPGRRTQAGAAYQVSMHLVSVLSVSWAAGAPGPSRHRVGHLISAMSELSAQLPLVKRRFQGSDHLIPAIHSLSAQPAPVKRR